MSSPTHAVSTSTDHPHPAPSVWGAGQLLAFSGVDGPTDFHGGLTLRTSGPGTVLLVKLPGSVRLELDGAAPVECALGGDHFDFRFASGAHVRGAFLDAHHLLIEGPCRVDGTDGRVNVAQDGTRTLVSSAHRTQSSKIKENLDAAITARRHWVASHTLYASHSGTRRAAVLKALSQMKSMVYAPEGRLKRRFSTPDRWPHQGMWLWDSAFHTIGCRHIDVSLAREILTAVLDGQQPDGRVPIRCDPWDAPHHEFTQPPTLTLAMWCCEQVSSDPAWVAGLAPRIEASLDWCLAHRSSAAGLPCWAIEGNKNCRSGESGLDNSSRFDSALQLEAVDFAAFLALEYELLARLHRRDGRSADAERCQARHARLCGLIQERLWSEEAGLFLDRDPARNTLSDVRAVTGFLPLLCGAATPKQAQRLAAQLENPRTFGTPVPLPSIAADDATFTDDMWRGPVWINMSWLVSAGFERYGLHAAAERVRTRTVTEIERWQSEYGTFFEFFDPASQIPPPRLRRKGRLAPEVSFYHQCFHDYGWTATLYLDLVCSTGRPLGALPALQ